MSSINPILIILCACILAYSVNIQAQDDSIKNEKKIIIEVKVEHPIADYIIYQGTMAAGSNGEILHLLTKEGKVTKIPFAQIISIRSIDIHKSKQENELIANSNQGIQDFKFDDHEVENKEVYGFKEKGLYISGGPDINFQFDGFTTVYPGIELAVGYKFKRQLSVGIGGSVRTWNFDITPSSLGHVFAEVRGYLARKNTSPYYRLKLGYGNSMLSTNPFGFNDFESSDGGLFVSPSVGLRMIGGSLFKLNLEIGAHHQRITYFGLRNDVFERSYKYYRPYIGISMMY